ncbi:hypothetical protein SAMN02745121_08450 [Nannocystis exedens]|uniref:Uncharacterized protein n=1 Tax=Nannocystis exedens TaxID=54 RepID=A0A1I2I590_9BACT|nr:hypothetical protein [Nannocystis exedens]PCC73570.1 hypothetical protein NAEX_06658 [Nannocystis exedens]SFF37452.1 hypothetical protein SAMN02745121_08450 [Nannocystis exedens]
MQDERNTEEPADEVHTWLANLARELFQTEQSAQRHPRLEAERLGDVPPAHCLRAVADHADSALAELPGLAEQYKLPVSTGGRAVGAAFSVVRNQFADMFLSLERSYRGTLLGMRHGVDLMLLFEKVARRDGAVALADWCVGWLEKRTALLAEAEQALAWFAEHPERALEAATHRPLARAFRATVAGIEHLADRLRQPRRAPPSVASESAHRDA